MKSTIILSTQRSGTTFLDLKLNGMYGLSSQGGELISPHFYHRHDVTELVRCDGLYNKTRHLKPGFHKTEHFNDNCYVRVDKSFLDTIVNKSNYVSFNVMLNAIKFDVDLIKQIDTPVLFLIRSNLWERSVSHEALQTTKQAHIRNSHDSMNIKNVKVTLDIQNIIDRCEVLYPMILKFKQELEQQQNVKIIYYEDIECLNFWTDRFIDDLESFMKVKFVNRSFHPGLVKTRDSVIVNNSDLVIDEHYVNKYYIDK